MANFRAAVYSSLNGAGARDQFSNTFEYQSDFPLQAPESGLWANRLANFIASLVLSTVTVNRVVLSTLAEEQPGANVNNFRSVAVQVVGQQNAEGAETEMYDINHVLVVHRSVGLGRVGAILVRGALLEGDVQVGANGLAQLSAQGLARFTPMNQNMGNSMVQDGFTNVLIRKLPGTTTPDPDGGTSASFAISQVTEFRIGGVRLNKRNHRYFDRKPKVPTTP